MISRRLRLREPVCDARVAVVLTESWKKIACPECVASPGELCVTVRGRASVNALLNNVKSVRLGKMYGFSLGPPREKPHEKRLRAAQLAAL